MPGRTCNRVRLDVRESDVSMGSAANCPRACLTHKQAGYAGAMTTSTILWIIAVLLVLGGIMQLLQGQVGLGIALIAIGCIVGPGGYSIFRNR